MKTYWQMDIFSFIKLEEPPMLLRKGQKVWIVNKADITEATVTGHTWTWDETENNPNNRGYRVEYRDGYTDNTWNKDLGERTFTDYNSAKEKAAEYIKKHTEIILAEDIKIVSTVAFSCTRKSGSTQIAFYCDIGNGMYYIKDFERFAYICKGKDGVKEFMNQKEIKKGEAVCIENFAPVLKNMYKTSKHSNWDYTECGCSYAVG